MNVSVNIPSWHRAAPVRTLEIMPFAKVWVDESEAEEYRRHNPGAEIISCPKGVQGNICRVRNYILRQELEVAGVGVCLMVDDDMKALRRFELRDGFGYNLREINGDEVLAMVEKYSIMAQDIGAKFWGVNCSYDKLNYKQSTPFSTMGFIGGPFQCFLKGNKCYYDENLPLKEDYDMTLQQLNKERVVLRVNAYHYLCEQSTQAGGCATYRNRVREQQQFEALQRKWGTMIVRRDASNKGHSGKVKLDDYNPIIKPPIRGV